jgi:hypothetical protein
MPPLAQKSATLSGCPGCGMFLDAELIRFAQSFCPPTPVVDNLRISMHTTSEPATSAGPFGAQAVEAARSN